MTELEILKSEVAVLRKALETFIEFAGADIGYWNKKSLTDILNINQGEK